MKIARMLYLIFCLFIFHVSLFSQVNKDQPGGYLLPSTGRLNILLVFAQFPDDRYDTTNKLWPVHSDPSDMNKWVEEKWSSTPEQGYLTHYFNEMSFNKLQISGRELSVTAPHSREWYLQQKKNRGYIHQEIITQIDLSVDFSEFDNWTNDKIYVHRNVPDSSIEMIIFIWRNIAAEFPQKQRDSIERVLNFDYNYGSIGGTDITVDNRTRTIKMSDLGSGATIRDYVDTYKNAGRKVLFKIVVHEFAHYLLGHNNMHNGFGFWGMLASWGIKGFAANSFEKHRLGWITLKTLTANDSVIIKNVKLPDFLTSGIAYRFVIDSTKGRYFYLENHQAISYWEKEAAFSPIEPGLYVLRKDAVTTTTSNDVPNSAYFRMIPADGRYKWDVMHKAQNPWGSATDSLPVYKKTEPDAVSGFTDLEFIPWTWNGKKQKPDVIHFIETPEGKTIQDVKYAGDGSDAFRIGYNQVFSPWSNPNSQDADRNPTPFGFYLKSISSAICTLDLYVKTSLEAPPSKPQGLKVSEITSSGKNQVKLKWLLNKEDDVSNKQAAYIIEKKTGNSPFTVVGTVNGLSETYIDDTITTLSVKSVSYRIRAKDKSGLMSVYSDIVGLK